MSVRVFESVSVRIANLIDNSMNFKMNIKEVQKEMINIMNVVIDENKETIDNEYMNEIHISLSKIMFSKSIEMIIAELNCLNEIMKGIIKKLTN